MRFRYILPYFPFPGEEHLADISSQGKSQRDNPYSVAPVTEYRFSHEVASLHEVAKPESVSLNEGRSLLRVLAGEPLSYEVVRQKGSHRQLRSNKGKHVV